MQAPLSPVELAQANLRAAVLVLLHELAWDNFGQRHAITLSAQQDPDGRIEGDLQVRNDVTGDLWGASL